MRNPVPNDYKNPMPNTFEMVVTDATRPEYAVRGEVMRLSIDRLEMSLIASRSRVKVKSGTSPTPPKKPWTT